MLTKVGKDDIIIELTAKSSQKLETQKVHKKNNGCYECSEIFRLNNDRLLKIDFLQGTSLVCYFVMPQHEWRACTFVRAKISLQAAKLFYSMASFDRSEKIEMKT